MKKRILTKKTTHWVLGAAIFCFNRIDTDDWKKVKLEQIVYKNFGTRDKRVPLT